MPGRAMEAAEATAEDWYHSTVDPRAPVSQYMSTAPKGMTMSPQSAKVRKLLLRDLNEYGVQLEHTNWPPPMPESLKPEEPPAAFARSYSTPALSFTDLQGARGPHIKVVRRGAYGEVVVGPGSWERSDSSSRRTTAAEPRRLWHRVPAAKAHHKPKQDAAGQSAGFPTAFWRPRRVHVEDKTLAGQMAVQGQKPREVAKPLAPGQPLPQRIPSDTELRNAVDTLKGQASLHTAAVSDRFRFAADMSAGAPVVIRGAGVASGTGAACWSSDASALLNFHHGQIRKIAKSGLEPLKEPATTKKKKKKKDDIEDLQLSDSGLFQPKYPIDSSLMSLRRLKKTMFPEVVQREQEEAARLAALKAAAEEEAIRNQAAGLQAAFRESVASAAS